MSRTTTHQAVAHAAALEILDRFLISPEWLGQHLYVPRPRGLMRHVRGMQLHTNPELLIVAEGVNRIRFPAETHDVAANTVCLVPRGMPHTETFVRREGRFRMLSLMLFTDRINFLLPDLAADAVPAELRHGATPSDEAPRIAAAADDLAQLAAKPDDWSRSARDGLAYGILAWIGAILQNRPTTAEQYSFRIVQVINLVSQHLEEPALGTAMLAEQVGCAPDYLSSRFHRETGIPLIQHIHRLRIDKAQYLLTHSPMIVKEIAAACGFANPDYFSRVFRKTIGQSPRAFRSRHRTS